MSITFSNQVVYKRLTALTDSLDLGGNGVLSVYAGLRPLNGQAVQGTLLALFTFDNPSLDYVAGGVLVIRTPPPTLILATGQATWGRLSSGNGSFVADVDVGEAPADIVITGGPMLYAGGQITITVSQLREV